MTDGSSSGISGPHLVVEVGRHAGESVPLGRSVVVMGRSSKCQLTLRKSAGVSRQHAQIVYKDGKYAIQDLDSRNGTYVNGEEVIGRYPLNDGDVIEISDERIRYHGPSGRSLQEAIEAQLSGEVQSKPPPPSDYALMAQTQEPFQAIDYTAPGMFPDQTAPMTPEQAIAVADTDLALPARDPALPRQVPPPQPPVSMNVEVTGAVPPPRKKRGAGAFVLGLFLGVLVMIGALVAVDIFLNEAATVGLIGERIDVLLAGESMIVLGGDAGSPSGVSKSAPLDGGATRADAGSASGDPKPEDPKPDDPKPEDPKPEDPKPEDPKPDDPKPEDPKPEDPKPDDPGVERVELAAKSSGKIARVLVKVGDKIKRGDGLVALKGAVSPRIRRKLSSLRKEEKMFEKAAARGSKMAQRDLADVRRSIARYESRASAGVTLKASAGGVVVEVKKKRGDSVKAGEVIVVVEAPGG